MELYLGTNFEDELETILVGEHTLQDYLHGRCEDFAYTLNCLFGYDLCFIVRYDEVQGTNVLVHAYCVAQKDNKTYYVDARGITDNIDTLLEEFLDELEYSAKEYAYVTRYNSIDFMHRINQLGIEIEKSPAIDNHINQYRQYYKL